ncbi:NosD domain-containing protein [Methanococcus maripaludis]|uniref:NosD domain-containing protein n=1 Tax=Methanococcus maripaludis TaxID=39152 RepID=UPI0015EB6305|nr:NosD domain-containing protein [Methanococcus maripaludis]
MPIGDPDPIDYNHITSSNYASTRVISNPGTYYLMEDITNAERIEIKSDNVILDGQGHILNTNINSYGIYSSNHANITIKNVKINSKHEGIVFNGINSANVENNTINTTYLCSLWGSGYNLTVINNSMSSGFGGNYGLEQLTTYTVSGNTINGKTIYFYKNTENIGEIPSDAAQIIISNCTNGQIKNLLLDENAVVIYIGDSSEITVENCTIKPNIYQDYQLYLINSENCNITGNIFNISENTDLRVMNIINANNLKINRNTIEGMFYGFNLNSVTNSCIFENNITVGKRGLYFWRNSANNTISGNTITSNQLNGIDIIYSNNNTISGNTITSNQSSGIEIYASDANIISGNAIDAGNTGVYVYVEPMDDPDSKDNLISGNTINAGNYGVSVKFSNNNTISGNTINATESGIYQKYADNSTISGNTINDCEDGLNLDHTPNIMISNCTFSGNNFGIDANSVYGGTVTGCTFESSTYGISLDKNVENTTITYNEFFENLYGLKITGTNNWIYLNNFENNSEAHVYSDSLTGNYFHSPFVNYKYDGKVYTGRLGNYYDGEELGTSVAGIFEKPYWIIELKV